MLDAFFVMPNHIHGIVFLGAVPEEDSTSVGTSFMASAPHNRKGARWDAGPSG